MLNSSDPRLMGDQGQMGVAGQAPGPEERTSQNPMPTREQGQEELPERIQNGFKELMRLAELESDPFRRPHIRQWLESEQFWMGNQYPIWSEREFNFRTPFEYALRENKLDEQPIYEYVINIYQAYGLSVIASLAQRLPKVRFSPKSATSEVDLATSKASSDVADLIEKNNRLRIMAIREAYLLWTQGVFGSYVRFVRDKAYGTTQEPIVENSLVEVAPDRHLCSSCGNEDPLDTGDFAPSDMSACTQCGSPMGDANFMPAEHAEVPIVSGYKDKPNGQEKISIYGAMNLKVMPYVNETSESGYLFLVEEVHKSALRATYPDKRNAIGKYTGGSGPTTLSEGDSYEKNARMSLANAPAPYGAGRISMSVHTATYKRCWFRPWFFQAIEDEQLADDLAEMFPSGAYVAFADGVFLEAYEEDMDEHWTICKAMPGVGMYTQAIGGSTMPLQKQINDAANIVQEHIDFGSAPPVLFDARFINGEALKNQRMRPATYVPVATKAVGQQKSLRDMIFQPDIHLDANIYGYGRSIIELVQVVSGAMPSIFGGQTKGNETLGGQQLSRDQALGKLQIFWSAVKQHHADSMMQAVNIFRENRTEDVELAIFGKSQAYTAKYIRLGDLQGNVIAEPEADEDFPASWSDIRANLLSMMEIPGAAPVVLQLLMHPSNAPIFRKFIANPDIVLPTEDNREKQYREIDDLLQGSPVQMPPTMTPMGPQPGPMVSTIPPDIFADDHDTHILAAQEWAVKDGMDLKTINPAGYANVMAHILDHEKAKAQKAQFLSQMQVESMAPVAQAQGAAEDASNQSEQRAKTAGDIMAIHHQGAVDAQTPNTPAA